MPSARLRLLPRLARMTVGATLLACLATGSFTGSFTAPASAQVEGPVHDFLAARAMVDRHAPQTDRDHRARDLQQQRQQQQDHDIALAATWQPDPDLFVVRPTDSDATVAARERLAAVVGRLQRVVADYDRAQDEATRARTRARVAAAALRRAQAELAAARKDFRRDKDLLLDAMTGAYTTGSLGALGMMLTADSDDDQVPGMTVLKQLTRDQSNVVVAADRSRDRLRRAQLAVAAADREARRRLDAAQQALGRATRARASVLHDIDVARRLLRDSVLADQEVVAAASGGYRGDLSFPLPTGTSFVDQDNWGHRSDHWASVHTGDDLSTGCGTPVLAANDGTVLVRTDQGWAGPWLVMVQSGSGDLTTWYAHMQALHATAGEEVEAGQQIGVVGQQGNATGCHLHFEVHPDGGSIYQDDTDPEQWLHDVGIYPGDA